MVRTQISLQPDLHQRARRKAAEEGISLAEYFRRLARQDLEPESEPKGDISAIFGLGSSGGSDIAKHKDRYIAEATWREYLRKTGRLPKN